jgi:hypothetical protein
LLLASFPDPNTRPSASLLTRVTVPGSDMPCRDDEQMAGTDREPVPQSDDVCGSDAMAKDDALAIDLTERAEHRCGVRSDEG